MASVTSASLLRTQVCSEGISLGYQDLSHRDRDVFAKKYSNIY